MFFNRYKGNSNKAGNMRHWKVLPITKAEVYTNAVSEQNIFLSNKGSLAEGTSKDKVSIKARAEECTSIDSLKERISDIPLSARLCDAENGAYPPTQAVPRHHYHLAPIVRSRGNSAELARRKLERMEASIQVDEEDHQLEDGEVREDETTSRKDDGTRTLKSGREIIVSNLVPGTTPEDVAVSLLPRLC